VNPGKRNPGILGATDFEVRYRFWVFGLIFFAGFQLYAVDHVTTGVWIAELLRHHPIDHPVNVDRPDDRNWVEGVFWVAALLVAGAALLRTWAAAYLRSRIIHSPLLHQESVVADGPYRHVRNPLYLGNVLLAIGIGLAASRSGFCLIVAGTLAFNYRLILREEAELEARQGEAYRRFAAAVPRMFPRLTPGLSASGARPEWGQAVRGELFMWLFAASSAIFAATLNGREFTIATSATVAIAAVNSMLIDRQRRKRVSAP
jgi:protein-S-isoprenylcysteine O-methyltransferase Ste14